MKNIKVNYKDENGNRTSTTVNGTIAFHYYMAIMQEDIDTKNVDIYIETRSAVQKFVNTLTHSVEKDNIESQLIFRIVRLERAAVIEPYINKQTAPTLL